MQAQTVFVAQIYSYDAKYHYYKKTMSYTLYYGNSQHIYLVDALFRPISAKLRLCEDLDDTYIQFRKLNIPALNQFSILQKMHASHRNLIQICLRDISDVRCVVARSVVCEEQQESTLICYKQEDQLQSFLVLGVNLVAPLQRFQHLSALGISQLKSQLEIYKELESTQFELGNTYHVSLLAILLSNLKHFAFGLPYSGMSVSTDLEVYFANTSESAIYRRIGFQSNRPASDFRSSGLFGLLSLIYFSRFDCEFLFNKSYTEEAASQDFLLDYLRNTQSYTYRYPIAVSVITIAKFVIQQLGACALNRSNLANCLLNQYAKETGQLEARESVYQQIIGQCSERLDVLLLPQQQGDNSAIRMHSLAKDADFTGIPAMPLIQQKLWLSAAHPRFFGSILLLICKIVALLDRRLQAMGGDCIYMKFNEQMRIVEADFKRVAQMDDIGDLQDFIIRMDE